MPLKATPLELYQEAIRCLKLNDKVSKSRKEMIRAYAGEHYRSDWSPAEGKVIDNRFDEWIRLVLPQIVFDNPTASIKTNRSGVNKAVPRALEAAINWWSPQVQLDNVLIDVAMDAAFSFGVVLTTYGPPPGREPWLSENDQLAISSLPRVSRLDPQRWFCDDTIDRYDPQVGQGRLAGHMFRVDKEELLKDNRFNRDAVIKCATGEGQRKWGGEKNSREDVFGYEIWVPEIKTGDEPDAHGTIYTIGVSEALSDSKDAHWLRDPRPYIGPAWGPYTLFGFGVMPGCPYPYSPFAASWDQIKMLNQHVLAAETSARRHKRFGVYDAANTQAGDAIRKVKDGEITAVRGLKDGEVKEMTLGGVTKEQHDHIARRAEQADRSLSLSETARGNVGIDASATAIADAASQRSARIASMKRLMTIGAAQVLRTAAWHLYTHEDAVFPLPPDVAEGFVPRPKSLPEPSEAENIALVTGGDIDSIREVLEHEPEVIYGGGPSEEVITKLEEPEGVVYVVSPYIYGTRFEDFELEIEPYSMERVDEALLQRRSMQVFEVVSNALPLIMQFPQAKWEDMLDMIGEPINIPDLSERTLGRSWLAQLRAAADGQSQPMAPQPQAPQPGSSSVMPRMQTQSDGADGMSGQVGEQIYGGGNLARASQTG